MTERGAYGKPLSEYRDIIRDVGQWQLVGDDPSDKLTGLGDHDPVGSLRYTFVNRHDLPNLGVTEIPMLVAMGAGCGGGDGPNNGALAQIISDDPRRLAVVHGGGFWTVEHRGDDYVRWQRWRTVRRPGWEWTGDGDRTRPPDGQGTMI